jgi:16S rRNA C967 or C1407 C5-methylase (RsmB/RsmF family)/NOL1/NOP2/fmu family ribosome biogenesis protein
MLPERFIQRIRAQEYIDAESLISALGEPSPVSIRINPLKWNKKPEHSEQVPWCPSGFYLEKRPSFTSDPLFHSGCYYPQEASGMFLEQVFRQVVPADGFLRILDLCGAPGGKSTHIATLLGSRGFIVSNEVIRTRASILAENISKWGAANTLVTQNDPSSFSRLVNYFDVIIVDAPCSGEGMFRDQVAVREWSEKHTLHCSDRQKRILTDVWPALKENGILIYSTCTFNKSENEDIIEWLVSKYMGKAIKLDISGFEGIKEIGDRNSEGYAFYPGLIKGEGLFLSVIRKEYNEEKSVQDIRRKQTHNRVKTDQGIIREWTVFPQDNIISQGDELFYFPGTVEDHLILSQGLKFVRPGTRICKIKRNGCVPAHDLAISEGIREEAFKKVHLDLSQALTYLRREKLLPGRNTKGWFLVLFNGINLGFCNDLGNRVNNYYPVDWRIRMKIPENVKDNIITWAH